ncbi:MAG: sigma 54-interacting transcriptional regulator [Acidimicrobiaceae bacterium]|nr:sigma 54-interacting transcriptional regulator [Acidimicrobiaceae bacterium]MCY4281021.1 sigma 54-interacting transcriptional regulator [Acidimicrobiaceae bacterium]MCY4294871.1 sigma 54-interacting transcriptional regulator [Acidimicrobiaceae bacterium]
MSDAPSASPSAQAAAAGKPDVPAGKPATLGELRDSGWRTTPVRRELQRNAVARISSGRPLLDGIVGYHNTVIPQLENALLAGHDMIMLGERGQAKTRMIRSLVSLLDEWLPIVAGSEINDDPFAPVSAAARALVAEHGDDTPVGWLHRSERYSEKLATPDTSIADLIGEVDPIKVAEGRYLADELTLHYGLVPRANRGIFAVNELPDLAERIQVGLLNVLEERDVQIRGYKVRLRMDLVLVASANPEDYTNRGRIITPLKDRFGAQVRTHYPLEAATEIAIVAQEADLDCSHVPVTVPAFMSQIVVALTRAARASAHVSQRSGVSVRLSIANTETLAANAVRRRLRSRDADNAGHAVPRVTDLEALKSSSAGKIEIEALQEDRTDEILQRLLDSAVLEVFSASVSAEHQRGVVAAFDDAADSAEAGAAGECAAGSAESAKDVDSARNALVVDVGDDIPDADYAALLTRVPALAAPVRALLAADEQAAPHADSPAVIASAVELILEGLHLSKRLKKDSHGARSFYRARCCRVPRRPVAPPGGAER